MDKNTKTKYIILAVLILLIGAVVGYAIHTPTQKHHKKTHTLSTTTKHAKTHKKHALVLVSVAGNITSVNSTSVVINGTTIKINKATKVWNGSTKINESTLNNTQKVDVLGVHTKSGTIAKFIVVI